MSTTNYPSGSKLNPLSEDIHQHDVAHQNWMGGWVGTSDNPTYYDRQNVERTCNGSLSSPYDADVYDELTDNAMWIGGWVLEEDENGEPVDFQTYFTATGTAYPGEDEDGNVFGSEDNPIPIAVYEEMCELDIWTGGWVVYPNGTTEEFPENEGGASGSGSGSGCGCGCGNNDAGCGCGCGEDEGGSGCGSSTLDRLPLTAGSETFGFFENNTNFHLRISWGSGVFSATEPQPSVDCTEEGTSIISSTDSGGNMSVTWYAPYIVRISGEFDETHITFTQFYNIPESYRH